MTARISTLLQSERGRSAHSSSLNPFVGAVTVVGAVTELENCPLLHACWSVCEHLSSFSSLPGADPCLKRASRLKRTRDEWHLLEEKAGRVSRVYRRALTELEWMQVRSRGDSLVSSVIARRARHAVHRAKPLGVLT